MWQADIIEGASNDKETIEDTKPPVAKEKKLGPTTRVTSLSFTEYYIISTVKFTLDYSKSIP